jgi:hypothetical protein
MTCHFLCWFLVSVSPNLNFLVRLVLTLYRRTRGVRLTGPGLSPFCKKVWIVHTLHFPFLLYSYVKSHVDNDSCLPIYKTIPAICNTPRQTQCVRNSIFPHFVMVITCRGPSCGLWLCVGALIIEGAPKIFRKLLHRTIGIIAVEISRTGLITTVIFFLYS